MATEPKEKTQRQLYEDEIRKGYGQQIGNRVYTRIEDLPDDVELAKGNLGQLRLVESNLQDQIKELDIKLKAVQAEIAVAEKGQK
jgi:hypothetical protein